MEQTENTLSVLKIAPGQYPQQVEIDNDLKALQQAVGGSIGASYPFEDPVAIVYNDDGKLMGLPLNRALWDEDGLMYDVMEIRKEERKDWTRAGQNRGTSQDLKAVSEALSYLRQKGLSTVEDLEAFLESSGKSAADYLEETYGLTNEKKIDNVIGIVANENKYHPIRDYLSALVWDGTERIRFCLRHFLGADADDYTYEALKLFLLGAISRAFQPGCKFEIMLCLVGGQGAGKSTFFRLLAVRDEWFSDDLRKLDDDNVYRKLQGHWIIEMSEMMATANAKSIEEIKSFLSRQKEVYKIPYAARSFRIKRS